MTEQEAIKRFEPIVDNEAYTDSFQDACRLAIKALEQQQFFNPPPETAVEARNVYGQGYMRGYQDGLDKGHEWLVEALQRIVKRLEELQEEYMYPDDDDYIVGQYDGVREALTVILEEGGLNETW